MFGSEEEAAVAGEKAHESAAGAARYNATAVEVYSKSLGLAVAEVHSYCSLSWMQKKR